MSKVDRNTTTDLTFGLRRRLWRSFAGSAFACVIAAQLVACGSTSVSEENSRLRRQNYELTEMVADLKDEVKRRDGQIEALTKKQNTPWPAIEGVKPSDMPVVSKLEFGAYSGAYDGNGDGTIDTVRIYLLTMDQRGWFYPAVGKAVVQVVQIDANQPPRQLARKEFDPKAFSSAYVSGFTGTHFTLELKFEPALPKDVKEITIQVTYTDAATGAVLTQQLVSAARSGTRPD